MDWARAAAVCRGQGWPGHGVLEVGQAGPAVGLCGGCEDKAEPRMTPRVLIQPHAETVALFPEITCFDDWESVVNY